MFLLIFKNLWKEWFTSKLKWRSSKSSGDTRRWGRQPLNRWESFLMWLVGCINAAKIFWVICAAIAGSCGIKGVWKCQEGDPNPGCFSQERCEPFAQQMQVNSRDRTWGRQIVPALGNFLWNSWYVQAFEFLSLLNLTGQVLVLHWHFSFSPSSDPRVFNLNEWLFLKWHWKKL